MEHCECPERTLNSLQLDERQVLDGTKTQCRCHRICDVFRLMDNGTKTTNKQQGAIFEPFFHQRHCDVANQRKKHIVLPLRSHAFSHIVIFCAVGLDLTEATSILSCLFVEVSLYLGLEDKNRKSVR